MYLVRLATTQADVVQTSVVSTEKYLGALAYNNFVKHVETLRTNANPLLTATLNQEKILIGNGYVRHLFKSIDIHKQYVPPATIEGTVVLL